MIIIEMKILLVAALLTVVYAGPFNRQCSVGEWENWSECTPSQHCQPQTPATFSVPINPEWDSGRMMMERMMRDKQMTWARRQSCRETGECPELFDRPSTGSFECIQGHAGDIPCSNVDQLSFLNFADQGYGTPLPNDRTPAGNDIWGWVDPLTGDEYAIMGMTGGTSFVRITDPVNPVPVGFIYSATVASSWRDIKVIDHMAYIVSEAKDHGLQVFDLRHLRGRQTIGYFKPDYVNNDFGNGHNIVENSDRKHIYVVGATSTDGYPKVCKGGLMIYDVSVMPPRYLSCYGDDGYVHDAQCVDYHGPDTRYTGREICFSFNEDTLTIVDVTDKKNMKLLSKAGYRGAEYTHQGWLTEDHELLLLDDELDESGNRPRQQFTKTYVWDVKNLEIPALLNIFESSERSIDHNQYIIGDLTYQANYEAGLRILHINRTTNRLSQVAYFDVLPSSTQAIFNGAWSVYPYYPSGTVVVSSIDYGMFVVKPNMTNIRKLINSGDLVQSKMTRVRKVIANAPGNRCPLLLETKSCKTTLQC